MSCRPQGPDSPARVSFTSLGRDILSNVQAYVFMNMEPALCLLECGLMEKLSVEHKMLSMSFSVSKTLTYCHIKSSIH